MKRSTLRATLTVALALTVTPLFASEILVSAGNWGKKQTSAIAKSGGKVVWFHQPTSTALVEAGNPKLYDKLLASGAFQQVMHNFTANWVSDERPTKMDRAAFAPAAGPISNGFPAVDPSDDADYWLQWAHDAVDSEDAWAAGCTGAGVRVAVIDGGINELHEDLVGQVDTACSVSFVSGQPWNFDEDPDGFWHANFVAGIIAAKDNAVGGVGIAPSSQIVGVKVMHDGSGDFDDIIEGMLYVGGPQYFGLPECGVVPIANMSLGIAGGSGYLISLGYSPGEINSFLAFMTKIRNWSASRGVLFVGSAGNESIDFGQYPNSRVIPNQLGNGIVVSATGPTGWWFFADNYDEPASYSNFGEDLIWVSAPGGSYDYYYQDPSCEIYAGFPCYVVDMWYSQGGIPNDSYFWAVGTSFSSPTAAGVAALMKGANPGLGRGDLKVLLKDSAYDSGLPGHDEFHGHGFVNSANACALAQASAPPV